MAQREIVLEELDGWQQYPIRTVAWMDKRRWSFWIFGVALVFIAGFLVYLGIAKPDVTFLLGAVLSIVLLVATLYVGMGVLGYGLMLIWNDGLRKKAEAAAETAASQTDIAIPQEATHE